MLQSHMTSSVPRARGAGLAMGVNGTGVGGDDADCRIIGVCGVREGGLGAAIFFPSMRALFRDGWESQEEGRFWVVLM